MSTISNASSPQSSAAPAGPHSATNSSATNTVDSLKREADLARQAFSSTLHDLKHGVQTAADPCAWAQQHPWITVGVAAAAGFAAANALTGNRTPPAVAPNAAPPPGAASSAFSAAPTPEPTPTAGLSWSAMLFDLARILLTTQLVPIIRAWQQASADNRTAGPSSTDTAAGNDASSAHNGHDAAAGRS